ncbi:unnamed protein product [Clavelina lepadiformis]|uniref:Uncharacterized protein n=1 Tax=Clavelina lepadiformis TaxID=159417 RepID=A0ABP0GLV1_CLALP
MLAEMPPVRIELTTPGLQDQCSTPELWRRLRCGALILFPLPILKTITMQEELIRLNQRDGNKTSNWRRAISEKTDVRRYGLVAKRLSSKQEILDSNPSGAFVTKQTAKHRALTLDYRFREIFLCFIIQIANAAVVIDVPSLLGLTRQIVSCFRKVNFEHPNVIQRDNLAMFPPRIELGTFRV